MDRFVGFEVFSRIAALGSLSAAARALGLSQTMATKHMASLEGRLGVKLLHRTTRRITLTEAGRRYLESVERVLGELHEADATALAERVEVTGLLRVNAPVSFGLRVIAPLLPALSERHPELKVDLGLNDRVVDLVEEGWDVAVRIGKLRDDSLIARKLAPCRLVLAASPDYLARHGRPTQISDLPQHNCLAYTLSSTLGPKYWRFGTKETIHVPIAGNLQANNGDALMIAARAGQGLVYEPTFILADDLRAGSLVALSLDHPVIELDGVFAVYPGNRNPPAKVRAFVDYLLGCLHPLPPWDREVAALPRLA